MKNQLRKRQSFDTVSDDMILRGIEMFQKNQRKGAEPSPMV